MRTTRASLHRPERLTHAPRLFHLLAMARQNLARSADRVFQNALGVSATHVAALLAIENEEGGLLKNLTQQLQIKNSAVTGLVQRMTEAGLIRRETSRTDGRAGQLFVSDKGRAVTEQAKPLVRAMNAKLMAGFADEELAVIVRFLSQAATMSFDEEPNV